VSGLAVHAIAKPTNDPTDRTAGMVSFVTDARIEATFASGRTAFVYVTP
jgi:hypothetical protein